MSKKGMRRPDPKEPNAQTRRLHKKSGDKNPPALQNPAPSNNNSHPASQGTPSRASRPHHPPTPNLLVGEGLAPPGPPFFISSCYIQQPFDIFRQNSMSFYLNRRESTNFIHKTSKNVERKLLQSSALNAIIQLQLIVYSSCTYYGALDSQAKFSLGKQNFANNTGVYQ